MVIVFAAVFHCYDMYYIHEKQKCDFLEQMYSQDECKYGEIKKKSELIHQLK